MHDDAQADGGVERTVGECESVCVTACEGNGRTRNRPRPACGHGEHLGRGIDARDASTASGQQDGGASGSGTDIEHGQAFERCKRRNEKSLLRVGDERADRPAEPRGVELFGRPGIGVDRIGVMGVFLITQTGV